ncbi:hypothetical protein GGTG_02733 [Gaeumannomyces tritici R3-111a-1]|uniref:Uncharacterized protein n=1 Tax=Gaeumannomyces tritici (strain R3-111a-1) TaxID=644352 RepID=J3NN75_GAET3|nr:hypothetical protein GGTG_02733 [Gaeumannomyces tritici R3-111a-1]EJT77627.1 hypothetical protein GGTG_02733 [Gaeumannomyces tritici R3-111a-1]
MQERWEYSAPLENDQAQWERVVQEYPALHPKERFAYHSASGWDDAYHSHPELIDDPTIRSILALLTPEKTRRVLEGRQTADERDLGVRATTAFGWCDLAAWVRVCYDPELEDAYNQLVEQTELEDIGGMLDSGNVGLNNPLLYGHLAGAKHEAAIRGKHVKLLWLDTYGKCLWSNKIKVTRFPHFVGAFLGGYSLDEAVDNGELFDNEGSEQRHR